MFKINLDAAADIVKKDIRLRRVKQFEENDRQINLSIVLNDEELKTKCLERREFLRDLPTICDNKTSVELKQLLEESRGGELFK